MATRHRFTGRRRRPQRRAQRAPSRRATAKGAERPAPRLLLGWLEKAAQTAQHGIVIANLDGRILFTNEAEARMHGYRPEEIIGQDVRLFALQGQESNLPAEKARKIQTWSRETFNVRKDGSIFPVRLVSTAVPDAAGKTIGILTISEDITARRTAEEALERGRQELERRVRERTRELAAANALLLAEQETIDTGLLLVDRHGKVVGHNREFLKIWNIPVELAESASDEELLASVRDQVKDWEGFIRLIDHLYKHPAEERIGDLIELKSGRVLSRNTRPVRLAGGEIIGRAWHFTDVTERNRAERILQATARATGRFLQEPNSRRALGEVLAILGEATGAGRVYVFERRMNLETREEIYGNTHEWCRPGVEPQIQNPLVRDLSPKIAEGTDIHELLLAGKPVSGLTREMPEPLRKLQEEQSVKSFLLVPVLLDAEPWGFIGFDDCESERLWRPGEISMLEALAAGVGGAVARQRTSALLGAVARGTAILLANPDIDIALPQVMAILGEATDADRVFSVRRHPDGRNEEMVYSLQHEWCAPGVSPQAGLPHVQNVSLKAIGMEVWMEQLKSRGTLQVIASQMPEPFQAFAGHFHLRTAACAAIRCREDFMGFLGLSAGHSERRWTENEEAILGTLAAAVGEACHRQSSEEALNRTLARLETVISNAPIVLFAFDAGGTITLSQGSGLQILGLRSGELVGQSVFDAYKDNPGVLDAARRGLSGETVHETADVSGAVFDTWYNPLRDAQGRPAGLIGVAVDITSREKAERERRAIEHKLLDTQKLESLGLLAGGIAHDFNNLLMAILGNASLAALELAPGSATLDTVRRIEGAARRAADLTRQLLAYSGKGRFVTGPVDLNSVIQEMGELLRVSVSKQVSLRYGLSRELPAVQADATQLRQVVMNLIVNASEAIGEREGAISLSTGIFHASAEYLGASFQGEGLAPGEYIFLEVCDTGAGMDEAMRARVFDPFFTTKFTGRGLGLAAVLGIIRGHGGAIRVESAPGKGATFRLLFPPSARAAMPAPREPPAALPWRGKGRVLVIDDEGDVRSVAARMLEKLGLTAVQEESGPAGTARFREDPGAYVCVLLDMTMPQISGTEVLEEIYAIRPDARVVLMSGYSEQDAFSRFTGKSAAGFIQKPFTPEDLARKLEEVLRQR